MASTWVKLAIACAGAAMLSGCVGIRDHRGYVLDKQLAANIQVGIDNKDSVTKTLGRPSFTGQFDPNDWYYFARDTKTIPFRDPHITDQTLLHVRFDAAGNVASVGQTGKETIVAVDPDDHKTPTLGRKHSFFDELFGNIGVLNSGALGQNPNPDQ
jgi:outer membrane protein assembly factor BamE (lipoprotein component of BamABCDE complex)